MDYKVLDLEFASGVDPFSVSKTLGVFPDVVAEYYAGNISGSNLLDISEYGHTLTAYNSPVTSNSSLLDQDRNPLKYFALSSQYFAASHSEWMNCFDVDFTMTFVVKSPSSAPIAEKMLFCHGEADISGVHVSMDTSGYYKIYTSKGGSSVNAVLSTNKADDLYHVIHAVRSGTSLNIYVDGTVGTSADPSTFGIDVSETFYLGCYRGPANYWPGGWLYYRLQTSGMSTDEISRENAIWKGIVGGRGGCSHQVPTYTRAEASFAERVTGNTALVTAQPNWPTQTAEGGLLVQGSLSQLCQRTREFDQASWSTTSPTPEYTQMDISGAKPWAAVASDADGSNLIACVHEGYIYISTDAGVNWTKCESAGARRWVSVASDSDGSVLVAAEGTAAESYSSTRGYIYVSDDGGATWTQRANINYWTCVACDADGSFIVGCTTGNGSVYYSSNGGVDWTQKLPGSAYKRYRSVACDSDGSNLIACEGNSTGYVWVSTDSGANWANKTSGLGALTISAVASDDDGSNLAFAKYNSNVYTSVDGGTNWTARTVTADANRSGWTSIASDSDGSNLIVCAQSGGASVWTSSNGGVNWTERTGAYDGSWRCVASDADGSHLLACSGTYSQMSSPYTIGKVFLSTDSGSNWAPITDPTDLPTYSSPIGCIAVDSTATKLFAASANGYLRYSHDSGATWTVDYTLGTKAFAILCCSDSGMVVLAAVTSSYPMVSTDGGQTWSDCTGAGSRSWAGVACSSSGQYMAAAASSANIWTSDDYGTSWTERTNSGARAWGRIASSSTGAKLVAVVSSSGYIYTSPDYGATWTERTGPGSRSWSWVACSADGEYIVACASSLQLAVSDDGGASWNWRASALAWVSVACSASGQYMIGAVYLGSVYVSSNYGVDWSAVSGFGGSWLRAAISSSNSKLVVANTPGHLWVSSDYGSTWSQIACAGADVWGASWCGVACDSTGTKLAAVAQCSYVCTSADGGTTWTAQIKSGNRLWGAIASDADGSNLIAVQGSAGYVYTSSDSGVNWTQRTSPGARNWFCCASDNDGSFLLIGPTSYYLYYSNDSGASWNLCGTPGSGTWTGVACDATGTKLAACASYNYIWTSPNGGATWVQQSFGGSRAWQCIASSSDGSKLVAGVQGGYLYTSTNSGVDWTERQGAGSNFWYQVDCDTTGDKIVAAGYNPQLVAVSENGGVDWTTYTASGRQLSCIATDDDGSFVITGHSYKGGSEAVGGNLDILGYPSYGVTVNSTALIAPDGTTSIYNIVADTASKAHKLVQQITLTADYYTFEVEVEPGDREWIYVADAQVSNAYAYFNVLNGTVGTTGAGCTANIYTRSNRRRCAITILGTATAHTFEIAPAQANGTLAFAGDGSTPNIYVWEASCHLGKFQTLPMTRSTDAVTRSADSLTYPSDFIPGYFVGNSYQRNTLTIEVRVKCQYTDTNNIGTDTYRPFLTIGGNTGTATATRNHLSIRAYNQYVYASLYTDDLTATHRYMRHTVADANKWHTYKLHIDFTDLSASTFTKDDVAFTPGESADMSGTNDFDATNGLLRIGQQYDGTVSGFCEIDYIKIWVGTS